MYGNGSSQYLFNTLTQQTINITSDSDYPWDGTIVGSNLIYMNTPRNSSKGGISDFNIQTKQTTILFSYTIPSFVSEVDLADANARALSFSAYAACNKGEGSCIYEVAWDLVLHQWLLIAPPLISYPLNPQISQTNHFLAVVDGSHILTLYNTSILQNS